MRTLLMVSSLIFAGAAGAQSVQPPAVPGAGDMVETAPVVDPGMVHEAPDVSPGAPTDALPDADDPTANAPDAARKSRTFCSATSEQEALRDCRAWLEGRSATPDAKAGGCRVAAATEGCPFRAEGTVATPAAP